VRRAFDHVVEQLGPMLGSIFSPIFGNFRPKNGCFLEN
jgi:hypothetical protein